MSASAYRCCGGSSPSKGWATATARRATSRSTAAPTRPLAGAAANAREAGLNGAAATIESISQRYLAHCNDTMRLRPEPPLWTAGVGDAFELELRVLPVTTTVAGQPKGFQLDVRGAYLLAAKPTDGVGSTTYVHQPQGFEEFAAQGGTMKAARRLRKASASTNVEKAMVVSTQPMDRLVCGDVGFGKTEVAMRAIFRMVCQGRQVGLLAPKEPVDKINQDCACVVDGAGGHAGAALFSVYDGHGKIR